MNGLRLNFEDFVLDYDKTVARVIEFLGEDPSVHIAPKRYFDPAKSIKNIGNWKRLEGKSAELAYIEQMLPELCFQT